MAERTGLRRMIRVMFALAVVFGAYELLSSTSASKKALRPMEHVAMVSPSPVNGGEPSKPKQRFEGKRRVPRDTWGRDPFVPVSTPTEVVPRSPSPSALPPVVQPKSTASDLRLSAISRRGEEAWALINGSVCKVGDRVEGKRIVQIGDDRVVLAQGKHRTVLRFPGR